VRGRTKGRNPPGRRRDLSPGKKHWHGATDKTAMSHIAIQESKDGKNVEWLEKASDEQYLADINDQE